MLYMFSSIGKWLVNGVTAFIVVVLVCLVGVFLAREWFLWQGVREFRTSLNQLKKLTGENCAEKLQLAQGITASPIKQLRFTDSRHYVLEIVCSGFDTTPIVSENQTLAAFISKVPGSSGIVINPNQPKDSYVTLIVFGGITQNVPPTLASVFNWISAEKVIGLEDGNVVEKNSLPPQATSDLGPTTTCEGYGFSCCDGLLQAGTGASIANLPACPSGCFQQCVSRPVILSLQTDPLMEWEQRQVKVKAGAPVTFNYIAEANESDDSYAATLSYGDGESATFDGLSGSLTHTFRCASTPCRYSATLRVSNDSGVESVITPTAQVEVLVQ